MVDGAANQTARITRGKMLAHIFWVSIEIQNDFNALNSATALLPPLKLCHSLLRKRQKVLSRPSHTLSVIKIRKLIVQSCE